MEDYNKVPFREMVGEKITKKDSERGAESIGFPIHGGKPIKELYRTVYTGGDDRGYMKEPVTKIHRTVTNEEGVSQKTVKSNGTGKRNEKERGRMARNLRDAGKMSNDDEFDVYLDTELGDFTDEKQLAQTRREKDPNWNREAHLASKEHKEASVRDMIAGKNITGFVKGNGATMNSRRGEVVNGLLNETGRAIGDEMDSEDMDDDRLVDLLDRETYLNDARHDVADTKDRMMQNSFDLYDDQGIEVEPEYLRQIPSQNSEPVGHNGSGMGSTRGLMADALNNKEALLNAVKQEDGSEGLVLADDGHTLVNRNPHVSEERLRQDSDPLMRPVGSI